MAHTSNSFKPHVAYVINIINKDLRKRFLFKKTKAKKKCGTLLSLDNTTKLRTYVCMQ